LGGGGGVLGGGPECSDEPETQLPPCTDPT
jgi:hypothetical protein